MLFPMFADVLPDGAIGTRTARCSMAPIR
jgi:hypothetical protein